MTELNGRVREAYEEAFRSYGRQGRKLPNIHLSHYPYIGINHTIRVRNGEVFVRIAELCDDMPLRAHRALALILVGKLLRKQIPGEADETYTAYANSPDIRRRASLRRRARGRKVVTSSKGAVYDLDEIFDEMNRRFFWPRIPKPVLTWSARRTYRILGHHDAQHDHIAISRSLDSRDVPRFVVEYVVFHEMLHIAHPTRHINGRRHNHTPAFKADEEKFTHYHRAERWIERNVWKLKRAARNG